MHNYNNEIMHQVKKKGFSENKMSTFVRKTLC